MANLMDVLKNLAKPNRPAHGGKGLFWFSTTGDCKLAKAMSLVREPIWRSTSGVNHRIDQPDSVIAHDQR